MVEFRPSSAALTAFFAAVTAHTERGIMVRIEVDMTRHVFVVRVDDVLTTEDLAQLSKLWSEGLAEEGYAVVFNLGSASVTGLTLDDIQAYVDSLAPLIFLGVQAGVANTNEQRQALEAYVQMAKQAGLPAEKWQIFDNEDSALDWVVDNHSYGI